MKKIEHPEEGRLTFTIRLVPRASRSEIAGWTGDGCLKVRVTAAPVEQKANQELIKIVAKQLGVARSDVEIEAGHRSRSKRLTVPQTCENRLLSFQDI